MLFVTEPYPCRSGGFDFEQPFVFLLRLAYCLAKANLAQCSIIASTALLDKYRPDIDCYSPAKAGICSDQQEAWLPEWIDMLNGRLSPLWKQFYDDALDSSRPDVVYVWNVNEYLRKAANDRGIGTIYMEQGCIRTVSGRRYTVDPKNYGPRSHFRHLLDTDVLDAQPAAIGRQWIADHVLGDVFDDSNGIFQRRDPEKIRVCILGQKDDDVNNLLFSPFSNQQTYFESALDSLQRHRNVEITVRPHPLSSKQDSLASLFDKFDVHVDTGQGDIRGAISANDAFITVNSTAGFEALLCGKPTMVLGEAAYAAPRGDFDRMEDIGLFVDSLRENSYWTDASMNRIARMLALYVSYFSLPQHIANSASIHSELIARASSQSPDWLDRFMEQGSGMAALTQPLLHSQMEQEAGFTRYINFLHSTQGQNLSVKVSELQVENGIRIAQIAALESRAKESGPL